MFTKTRRVIAFFMAITLLHVYSLAAFAAPEAKSPKPMGDLSAVGTVLLDGAEAVSGITFFSGSEVRTAEKSKATISLGQFGRAELLPQTSLRLSYADAGVSGSLGGGVVRLSKPAEPSMTVATSDGSVVADAGEAAVFSVRYADGNTTVQTQSGKVRLLLKDKSVVVGAGDEYSTGAGDPAAAGGWHGWSKKKKLGLLFGIGGAIALILIIIEANDNDGDEGNTTPTPNVSPSR
jgi:ferric-dicitrate binding protein FerR (iron transport regulator)